MQFIAHTMEAIGKEREGGKCEDWRLGGGKDAEGGEMDAIIEG